MGLVLAGSLAACNDAREGAEPIDDGTGEAGENGADGNGSEEQPISILRPDVEQPQAQEEVKPEPLNVTIGFPDGGAELSADALAALEQALASEQIKLGLPIVVGGHSDAGGSDAANERASRARAEAVRDWLVGNGVADSRITVIAFGEQNPVEPNALPNGEPNEEGRAANRRVELRIMVPTSDVAQSPVAQSSGEAAAD
ncbi:MAG: OmpA family protein [Pseudomonadota bacterium]